MKMNGKYGLTGKISKNPHDIIKVEIGGEVFDIVNFHSHNYQRYVLYIGNTETGGRRYLYINPDEVISFNKDKIIESRANYYRKSIPSEKVFIFFTDIGWGKFIRNYINKTKKKSIIKTSSFDFVDIIL